MGRLGLGGRGVFQPLAFAGDGDYLRVVKEAVEDGTGGGDIVEQFAPVFQRRVAGHDRGGRFVAAHDHFEQILAGVLGELLEAHVIE